MNDKIVKKTQDTLGKIIKKPPMTEKLLNKPPFRFLHDIATSVIKTTGFMKGLYTETEMNSENVKDKDSKIAFLQKSLDIVGLATGKSISARPSKVVAGHEPEKTNEFLQLLAEAINNKPDNDDLVQRVLSGDKGEPAKPPSGTKKEKDPGSADRRKRRDKDKEKEDDKEEDKEDDRNQKRRDSADRDRKHREKSRTRDSSRDRERSGDKDREKKHRDKDRGKDDKEKDRKKRRDRDKEEDKENDEANTMVNGEKDEDTPVRIPRPTSAKGSRRRHREEEEEQHRQEREKEERREREKKEGPTINGLDADNSAPQLAAARRAARPSSARPAPPRIKKNEPPPEEPHIVGQGATPNVIVDKKDDDSDDEGFIAKEEAPPLLDQEEVPMPAGDEDDADHGGLVKKILETKKELEGGSQQASKVQKKTEIERSSMNDATKRKEREMVQKEIDKLRLSIQTLTRSANPLGKIMDFIQEDLDQMQKEVEMWKKEHKENSLALQREQSVTEGSIEPLRAQLSELDQAVADQLDLIAAVKSNIIRNDDRMEKMISTVTQS